MRSSPQDIWGLSAGARPSGVPPTRALSAPQQRRRVAPPPRPLPAPVTRHFPHRFPPPHGERSGTPARIAWERIDSPAATGTDTSSGRTRIAPGGGSDIGGGGGRGGG